MALENRDELVEVHIETPKPPEPPKTRLYQLRCRKSLEPFQLALKLGISTKLYNVYENNPEKIPANILIKLSNIFNVSIDYIVNNSDTHTKAEYIKKRIKYTLANLQDREKDNIDRIRKAFSNVSTKNIESTTIDISEKITEKFSKTSDLLNELFMPLPYIESELETTSEWKFKILRRIYNINSSPEKIIKELSLEEDEVLQLIYKPQLEEEIKTSTLITLFRELGISFNLITGEGLGYNELLFRRIAIKGKHLSNQNKLLYLRFLKYLQDRKIPRLHIREDILIPNEKDKLSDRIAYLRKVVGYEGDKVSQQELADLIKEHCTGKYKCSLRTVTKIENSNYEDDINIKYICIIAYLWDISIDYLLRNTNRNIRQTDFIRFYKKYANLPQDKQKLVEAYLELQTTERKK